MLSMFMMNKYSCKCMNMNVWCGESGQICMIMQAGTHFIYSLSALNAKEQHTRMYSTNTHPHTHTPRIKLKHQYACMPILYTSKVCSQQLNITQHTIVIIYICLATLYVAIYPPLLYYYYYIIQYTHTVIVCMRIHTLKVTGIALSSCTH